MLQGVFSTPLTAGFETKRGKRVGDSLKNAQVFPQHRFGTPSDFAQAVVRALWCIAVAVLVCAGLCWSVLVCAGRRNNT